MNPPADADRSPDAGADTATGGASGDGGTMSWRDLLTETTNAVGDRQHAWWLCEVASGFDGDELVAELDSPATQRSVAHLDTMVARVRTGEPLQYVLGRWGFRRLDLSVDRRVLIPRPETELLVDVALDMLRDRVAARQPITVADLGTGSGAIGLALADELPIDRTTVWLTDVDPDALDVARANLAGIGRAASNVRIASGSWFDAFIELECGGADDGTEPDGGALRFDVIVSNPPYVADGSDDLEPTVAEHEPARALFGGPEGLDHLRTIIDGAPSWLAPGGALIVEIGADQGASVAELLGRRGFVDVEVRQDLAGHDRVAVGRSAG